MPVSAPPKSFRMLAKDLLSLAKPQVAKELRKELAEEALAKVYMGFEKSQSPFGKKWAPIERNGMILLDTARLRNSITRRTTSRGFYIYTNVIYARIHNEGGAIRRTVRSKGKSKPSVANVVARQFLPYKNQLPPTWENSFRRITRNKLAGVVQNPDMKDFVRRMLR